MNQALVVGIGNTLLAFAVLLLSGSSVERTVYDRYLVRLEGISFPVRNLEQSLEFYRNVLDIHPPRLRPVDNGIAQLVLPDNRRMILELRQENPDLSSPREAEVLRIRVVNGFDKLQQALSKRSEKEPCPTTDLASAITQTPGCVSEIYSSGRGREFLVKDLDSNFLVFYKAKRFPLSMTK